MLYSRPRSVIDKNNNLSSAKSLTTYDLYKNPGYAFEINDLVKFRLLRGYKLKTSTYYDNRKKGIVEKSKNKNLNRTITGTIINYKPNKLSDLEIELIRKDGYEIILKLSQCKYLKILS